MRLKQTTPATIIACLMAASLPFSLYLFSFSIILLSIYWLFENNFEFQNSQAPLTKTIFLSRFATNLHEKIVCFINNRIALTITLIYLLYLVGSLWSTNTHFIAQEVVVDSKTEIVPMYESCPN